MRIKIIGYGWVGTAMHKLFPEAQIEDPALGYAAEDPADIAIVCVPTPNRKDGSLDTSIVEEVVKDSIESLIIIRSTLNPGDADRFEARYEKNICVVPEYLGEGVAHPLIDETARQFFVIGGKPYNRRQTIELLQTVYNANIKIRQVTNLEAEVIKLSENRAIMYKVMQCQELYDMCEASGVDYYTVREAVYGDDPRFNLYWTFVYPDKRGASSSCIPKDIYAWRAWAESLGEYPQLTSELLKYNEKLLIHA